MKRLLTNRDMGMLTAYLLKDETANTFLLGNLLYYGVEPDRNIFRCGDYWGYFDGDELVGVVAFFNNSQCMVYYTRPEVLRPMCLQIADNPIRLVLGSEQCVRPMAQLLRAVPGRMVIHHQLLLVHQGEMPHMTFDGNLLFQDARMFAGNRAVQDFIIRCMKDGFGYRISRGTARRLLQEKTEHEPYLLLKAGGKLVAQAHIQTRTPGFGQIGGVCTLPEERRRGYARVVVCAMMDIIRRDGGRRACLVVNDDNASARSLYDSLGFREAKRLTLIDFL